MTKKTTQKKSTVAKKEVVVKKDINCIAAKNITTSKGFILAGQEVLLEEAEYNHFIRTKGVK